MANRRRTHPDATPFREAISQWQLAARTEVKRASSLPSSMFDAADGMIEARLAETVETMMRLLQHAPDDPNQRRASGEHLEQRAEQVSQEELRAMPTAFGEAKVAVDLDEHVAAEYFNLLVEVWRTGDAVTAEAARERLLADIPADAAGELDAATTVIAQSLRGIAGGHIDADADLQDLERLCAAVAAAARLSSDRDEDGPA